MSEGELRLYKDLVNSEYVSHIDFKLIAKKLFDELQQKENIIKEVRELAQRYNILVGYYDGYECYDGTYDTYSHDTVKEELLEILDKKEVN